MGAYLAALLVANLTGPAFATPAFGDGDGDGDGDDTVAAVQADARKVLRANFKIRATNGPFTASETALMQAFDLALAHYISDPDGIDISEIRNLEQCIAASGRRRLEVDGTDPFIAERDERLALLARIRGTIGGENLPQIPGEMSGAVGHVPQPGTWQEAAQGGSSRAVPVTETNLRHAQLVGRNVRHARQAAELSQSQLAASLGVGRSRVADWEGGRHQPNPDHLAAIVALTDAPSVGWFHDEHPEVDGD